MKCKCKFLTLIKYYLEEIWFILIFNQSIYNFRNLQVFNVYLFKIQNYIMRIKYFANIII